MFFALCAFWSGVRGFLISAGGWRHAREKSGELMHRTVFTKALSFSVALVALGLLSACGQSRYQPVIAENVFAPATRVEDPATAEVQNLFANQQAAAGPTYSRSNQPSIPPSQAPVPVVTRPQMVPITGKQQPSYNCAVAPTTQAQYEAYQAYCAYAVRQTTRLQSEPTPIDAPSRPVFVSRSFDCTMELSNKAELTFFRAHCLAAVAAPIKVPVNTQVAAQPSPGPMIGVSTAAPTIVPARQQPVATTSVGSAQTAVPPMPVPKSRPTTSLTAWRPVVQSPQPAVVQPISQSGNTAAQQPLLTGSFQPANLTEVQRPATAPVAATAVVAPYDCDILPTTRNELALYQSSCS